MHMLKRTVTYDQMRFTKTAFHQGGNHARREIIT